MAPKLLMLTAICRLIVIVGLTLSPNDLHLIEPKIQLTFNHTDIQSASSDFGKTVSRSPAAVLYPSSATDIANLVKLAYEYGFTVSARGHGHSINGQATVANGVVVQMSRSPQSPTSSTPRQQQTVVDEELMYVDVWGGELWIDVLQSTLKYGLAPKSWTDYLYLSVGGTISNAGISGQAFNYGPQISTPSVPLEVS